MLAENGLCIFCEGGRRTINFTESNEHFLSKRIREGTIDEAITISRIACENFPTIKESADTKKIVETLLMGIQQTINAQVLTPINASISSLNTIMSVLEKNPELIQKYSDETMRNISGQLSQIVSSINGPTLQIQEMLSQLIYKPSVKGSVGEKVLAEIWPRDFQKDLIKMLGGAGREDFLVTPYLNTGFNRYGDRISVERKSGKQKYTGAHFEEAVRHSIERGATYSILAYDTQDNIPQKTMLDREKDVLVAIVDIESGTWKMAREIFEVLQKEMASQKRTISEINIQAIQEVVTDIGALVKNTSNIRGKTARIQNLIEKYKLEIDEDLAADDRQNQIKPNSIIASKDSNQIGIPFNRSKNRLISNSSYKTTIYALIAITGVASLVNLIVSGGIMMPNTNIFPPSSSILKQTSDYGIVNGEVTGQSAIVGGSVTVYKNAGLVDSVEKSAGYTESSVISPHGHFVFKLPSGVYRITVVYPDGKDQIIENYAVWPGSYTSLNLIR